MDWLDESPYFIRMARLLATAFARSKTSTPIGPKMHRYILTCSLLASLLASLPWAASDTSINLNPAPGTIVNCRAQLEFEGTVIGQAAKVDEANPSAALRVSAVHVFDQIHVDRQNALRKYSEALANINVDKRETKTQLSPSNQQLIVRRSSGGFGRPVQYFALGGTLTQPELELLWAPCDMLALAEVLAKDRAKVGESWSPTDFATQALFSLDSIIENNLRLTLKEVSAQNLAKIYITGDVRGEVDGCRTAIRISAVAVVDTAASTLKAFRANIAENRTASTLAPGFEGTAKIDMAANVKGSRDLNDQTARQVSAKINEKQNSKLLWNSDSEFELVYDPRWRIILSDKDVVLLRYADQGNVLAQCNIMSLPKRPADKPLSLADFQSQLTKNVIGNSQAKIRQADSLTTANGMKALVVNVAGMQEDIPITWLYYHVSDAEGRCAALVFIVEDSLLPSLANADLKLIESIRFTPRDRKADAEKATKR